MMQPQHRVETPLPLRPHPDPPAAPDAAGMPPGPTNWPTSEGTITTTETSTPYDLVRIVTYLTDDAEEAQGH